MKNRILYEKFQGLKDFQYFTALVYNEKIMKMNMGRVFTAEEAAEYYAVLLENSTKYTEFGQFKAFLKDTGEYIGSYTISIRDAERTEAEIEYVLLPDYWGHGYASEMVVTMLSICRQFPSIQVITAITAPDNTASQKILLKYGFTKIKTYKTEDGTFADLFTKKAIE